MSHIITTDEACSYLKISDTTFWRARKNPRFPKAIRIGRCVRWDKQKILDFFTESSDLANNR